MALDTMAMLPGLTMVDTTEDTGVATGARRRGLPSQNAAAEPNAEANAEPWYSAYGYGLGHYGGYRGYYGYARPYAYGYGRYWGRKKRSAEAEPAAEP